ncbi:Large-conductance mechanosensitive channel [bioreactor metagenome]|uniref:Large-conductance mechanosensitive channel n=1 Tax=bioreactor metagenome TaxID=1076179 RepID=A0A644T5K4_9ZZZZ|nr:MscL family protein [Candidatus Elulimicrobiales bacterium]
MKKEFINFVREKGVIGLAVGIIVGGAVTAVVNSIVVNFINPIVGALIGKGENLSAYTYTIPYTEITFGWGSLVADLITFLSILLVVYLLFVKSPLNKLDKPKEEAK